MIVVPVEPEQSLSGIVSAIPNIVRSPVASNVLLEDDAVLPILHQLTFVVKADIHPESLALRIVARVKNLIHDITDTLLR